MGNPNKNNGYNLINSFKKKNKHFQLYSSVKYQVQAKKSEESKSVKSLKIRNKPDRNGRKSKLAVVLPFRSNSLVIRG